MPLIAGVSRVEAADISVLTADALKRVLLELAPTIREGTGDALAIENDTAGAVAAAVARGDPIDLVILPAAEMDGLAAEGKLRSVTPVAKCGIGVVVKPGTTPPDISSVEAFRKSMLAVPSVAYLDPASGGSGGIYLAKLFARLGVKDAVDRKAVLVPDGLVAARVDDGEAVMGLQQINELRAVPGLTFVGPLPAEIQNYTVYEAAIPSAAPWPDAGRALLGYLRGEAAKRALRSAGLEPP